MSGANDKEGYSYMQFYTSDWLGDWKVNRMNLMEQGAYFRLLCHTWESSEKSLPSDDEELAAMVGLSAREFAKHRERIMAPFHLASDGRWHQKRIDKDLAGIKSYRQARSEDGRKAALKRWNKNGSPMPEHGSPIPTDRSPMGSHGDKSDQIESDRIKSDKNTYGRRYIDRKKPPFQLAGIFDNDSFKHTVVELLGYFYRKFDRQLDGQEFHSMMLMMQRFKSPRKAEEAIDLCMAKNWKNPIYPGEKAP